MREDVPNGLANEVRTTADTVELLLERPTTGLSPLSTATIVVGYSASAVGAAMLGPPIFFAHALATVAGLGLADGWRRWRVPKLQAGAEGWRLRGSRPLRARWIQLVGDPFDDGAATLWIDEHRIRHFPTGVEHPYPFRDLTWLGEQLSEVLRAPFRDLRDPIRWRAWEDARSLRIRHELDRRHAQSALQLPRSFGVPAYEPRDLEIDHDGVTFSIPSARPGGRTMQIGRDHVTIDGRRHPMGAVLGVAIAVEPHGQHWGGRLQIGLYDAIYEIGTARTDADLRMLRGIAHLLRDARARARRQHLGSALDVPTQLLDVRAAAEQG